MAQEQNYLTCAPFLNCTADLIDSVANISHCQPPAVQNISSLMLSSTGERRTGAVKMTPYFVFVSAGLVCSVGVLVNTLILIMFLYHHICQDRIHRNFGQDFSMTREPMVTLIIHLSICDLLYCLIGLPSYW